MIFLEEGDRKAVREPRKTRRGMNRSVVPEHAGEVALAEVLVGRRDRPDAVEAARPASDRGVDPVGAIGRGDDEDPVERREPVERVQEQRESRSVLDERVHVLEAEDAGSEEGRSLEGAVNELAALVLAADERLDDGDAGRRADGLEDRRLAVAGRPREEETAAVSDLVAAVELARGEELAHGLLDVVPGDPPGGGRSPTRRSRRARDARCTCPRGSRDRGGSARGRRGASRPRRRGSPRSSASWSRRRGAPRRY